jgi:predicted dehydrogenase
MEPVAAGLVGLGWWGSELLRGAAVTGGLRGVACFSRNRESREAFADQHGMRAADSFESLLADPEIAAMIIATPHSAHTEMVVAAAEAGKHVFVEKPFTMTVAEGRRCVEAADRAGVVLQVGHQRRRQTANRKLNAMVESGELGTIIAAEANFSSPGGGKSDPNNWRQDRTERPLSGLTPFGVHVIDTFHYVLGPIARVGATSSRPFGKTGLDDAAVIMFEFASGVVGTLLTSTAIPPTMRLGVMGSAGAAWNDQDGRHLLVQSVSEKEPIVSVIDPVDTVAEEMTEFAECVRTGSRPEVDGRAGLMVTAVVEAALRSAAGGQLEDVEVVA